MKKSKRTDLTVVRFPLEWGRLTFQEAETVALEEDKSRVAHTMMAALRVAFIHDTFFVGPDGKRPPRFKEAGHDSFKDWCEAHDRSEAWGNYLRDAARHVNQVENPRQARELRGLSDEEAEEVVQEARQTGPLTATSIAAARNRVVSDNRREAKQIELSDWLKSVEHVGEKMRKLLRREVGTEKAEGFLDQCLEAARAVAA